MAAPTLRKWTGDEYRRAVKAGLIRVDERLELLDGQIVQKMTQNPPHSVALGLVEDWLRGVVGEGRHVRSQGPITLSEFSEPEPDCAVARGDRRDFSNRHPVPAEIELVVEVSDSSLDRDRRIKAPLYTAGGIRELWILDLADRKLELHRESGPKGYRVVTILAESERACPAFAPECSVRVADLLPPVG